MNTEIVTASGRKAVLYPVETASDTLLVLLRGGEVAEALIQSMPVPGWLLTVDDLDWNAVLSPWPAPAVRGDEDFSGHADAFLAWLTDELMPAAEQAAGQTFTVRLIAGYSLAGLFALWCGTQTSIFSGAAAMSPSVWFDGFTEYLTRSDFAMSVVSLSLGDKEKRAGDPRMRRVEDALLETEAILNRRGVRTELQMEKGGHFNDVPGRMIRGISRLMHMMDTENHHDRPV